MTKINSLLLVAIFYIQNSGCLGSDQGSIGGNVEIGHHLAGSGLRGIFHLEHRLTNSVDGIVRNGNKRLKGIIGGIFGHGRGYSHGHEQSNGEGSNHKKQSYGYEEGNEFGRESGYAKIEREREKNGGSISIHGSFNVRSILKALTNLPIQLPRSISKLISTLARGTFSLNLKALKIPIAVIRTLGSIFRSIITGIVDLIVNINSVNADLVVGIIRRIKGIFGWIVTQIVNLNIFGLKTGYSVAENIHVAIDNIIGAGLKLIVWILTQFNRIVQGGIKLSHIEDIAKLPVIKQIIELHNRIHKGIIQVIFSQLLEIGKFIDMQIYKHRDFFYPIFRRILKIFLAFTDLLNKLSDDVDFKDISEALGGMKHLLHVNWRFGDTDDENENHKSWTGDDSDEKGMWNLHQSGKWGTGEHGGYAGVQEPSSGSSTANEVYSGTGETNSGSGVSISGSHGPIPESWKATGGINLGSNPDNNIPGLGEFDSKSGDASSSGIWPTGVDSGGYAGVQEPSSGSSTADDVYPGTGGLNSGSDLSISGSHGSNQGSWIATNGINLGSNSGNIISELGDDSKSDDTSNSGILSTGVGADSSNSVSDGNLYSGAGDSGSVSLEGKIDHSTGEISSNENGGTLLKV